jgi:signal transduction histidine kinase
VAANDHGGHEVHRLGDCDGERGPPRETVDSPERAAEQDRAEDVTENEDASCDQGGQLEMPDRLPALPAAVEVAMYRIATEALTNVARHAGARGAVLSLRCDATLDLEVRDDGPAGAPWVPEVGLSGMRERAAEVGGAFEAGPSATGGRVFVSIPLDAA